MANDPEIIKTVVKAFIDSGNAERLKAILPELMKQEMYEDCAVIKKAL